MYKKILAGITFLLLVLSAFAQTPDMYPPPDPEPVDPTPLNIVLYIVLPVILVIVFFLYRRSLKKRKQDKK